FASGELALKARNVADLVIQPQEIEEYASDKRKARDLATSYDFFIAEAPLMPVIGKRLGVVLGPRGRMPRPVPPTADPTNLINSLRNTVRVRSRDKRTSHAAVGTRDMPPDDVAQDHPRLRSVAAAWWEEAGAGQARRPDRGADGRGDGGHQSLPALQGTRGDEDARSSPRGRDRARGPLGPRGGDAFQARPRRWRAPEGRDPRRD